METVDTTQGARRKGDARLPVQYGNRGGADSADSGNTSIWQNCGIIPQVSAPQFFVFLKSGLDWCCWLLILIRSRCQNSTWSGWLPTLSNGAEKEKMSHPHNKAFKLDIWSEVTSESLHSFNIWFGKTCTWKLFCEESGWEISPLFLLFRMPWMCMQYKKQVKCFVEPMLVPCYQS